MIQLTQRAHLNLMLALANAGIYKSDARTCINHITDRAPDMPYDVWLDTISTISEAEAHAYYGHDAAQAILAIAEDHRCASA